MDKLICRKHWKAAKALIVIIPLLGKYDLLFPSVCPHVGMYADACRGLNPGGFKIITEQIFFSETLNKTFENIYQTIENQQSFRKNVWRSRAFINSEL